MFWSETPLHTHPTSHIKEQRWDWKKKPRGVLSYPKRKTRGNLNFFIECYVKVPNCSGKNQKPNQREQLSMPGAFFFVYFFFATQPSRKDLSSSTRQGWHPCPCTGSRVLPTGPPGSHQVYVFNNSENGQTCKLYHHTNLIFKKKKKLQKLAEQSRNLAHFSTPQAAFLHSGGKDRACRVMRASW